MLEAFAERTAGAPIGTVVNTHANGDHCYGNELVAGAEIIATEAAAEEMAEVPPALLAGLTSAPGEVGDLFRSFFGDFHFEGIEPTLPTRTFEGRLTLDVAGREVELIEVGPAHTKGDLLVHVPDARTVFTGDILFIHGTPIVWAGPLSNWVAACDLMLGMDVDAVVPGHGPLTDKAGITGVRDYLAFVDAEATARHAAGDRRLGRGAGDRGRDRRRLGVRVVGRGGAHRGQRRDRLPHARPEPPPARRRRAVQADGAVGAGLTGGSSGWRAARAAAARPVASEWRTARTHPTATQIAKMNHCTAYDRWLRSVSSGAAGRVGVRPGLGRVRRRQFDVARHDLPGELRRQTLDVDALHFGQVALGRVGQATPAALLGRPQPSGHLHAAGRRRGAGLAQRHEAALDEQDAPVRQPQRRDGHVAGLAVLGPVDDDQLLVGEVHAGRDDGSPLDVAGVGPGAEHVVERQGRLVDGRLDLAVEVLALVEPAELPEPEVDHEDDGADHDDVEEDPLRAQQEPVHGRR